MTFPQAFSLYRFPLFVQDSPLPGILHPIRNACVHTLAVVSPVVRCEGSGGNLKGSLVMVSAHFAGAPYIFFSLPFSLCECPKNIRKFVLWGKNSTGGTEFSLDGSWNRRNVLILIGLKYLKVSLNILLSVIAVQMIGPVSQIVD